MGRINQKTDRVYPVDYMFKKVDEMKQIIENDIVEMGGKIDDHSSQLALKATKTELQNIGNGSPKGVYSTLSALQTAFPTGTTGVYLVTADGKWYYWNGSAWTAGGIYQGTSNPNINDYTLMLPSNLVQTVVTGQYSYASGVGATIIFASDVNYGYIAIDVTPNTYYSINGGIGQTTFSMWGDANGKMVSKLSDTKQSAISGYVYLSPSAATKMYISQTGTTSSSDIVVMQQNTSIVGYSVSDYPMGVVRSESYVKMPKLYVDSVKTTMETFAGTTNTNLTNSTRNVYRQISNVTINDNSQWTSYNTLVTSSGYVAIEFPCNVGEKYKIVGAMAGYSTATTLYYLDVNGNLLSSTVNNSQTSGIWESYITIPKNCVKVRYTQIRNTDFNSQLLYQTNNNLVKKSQIIIVDCNGYGDYTNIQDAIDKCGDSKTNHVTILIYPGIYPRFSQKGRYRYVSLIGIDKANTIIQDNSGDYNTPTSEIYGEGICQNLTFIATHTDNPTLTGVTKHSYAMHSDYGTCNYVFENCKFVSYQQAAVGIGIADSDGNGMIFRNCQLFRYGTDGDQSNGALIVHTSAALNGQPDGTTKYQKFRMENCYFEVPNSYLRIANVNNTASNNRYDFSFVGCTFYANGGTQEVTFTGITLNAKSHGNNVSTANFA